MNNALDTLLIFSVLTFFHLWGGAAVGAGLRGRRALPLCWGLLVGGAPFYFGIERVIVLGSWGALIWQAFALALSALAVGLALSRLRAFFLKDGMTALMIGTFIMAAGAVLGAWLYRRGSEAWSLAAGGAGFMFGAMWFGAGVKSLRGR